MDGAQRKLERKAAGGDPEAARALMHGRCRAGEHCGCRLATSPVPIHWEWLKTPAGPQLRLTLGENYLESGEVWLRGRLGVGPVLPLLGTCLTCGRSGTDPCVTLLGKKRHYHHASRLVLTTEGELG